MPALCLLPANYQGSDANQSKLIKKDILLGYFAELTEAKSTLPKNSLSNHLSIEEAEAPGQSQALVGYLFLWVMLEQGSLGPRKQPVARCLRREHWTPAS